jgi:hypothetical protein
MKTIIKLLSALGVAGAALATTPAQATSCTVYSPWLDSHYYQCEPTYYGWGYSARYETDRRIQARKTSALTTYVVMQGSLNGGRVCYSADFTWDNTGVWSTCANGVDLITYKAAW